MDVCAHLLRGQSQPEICFPEALVAPTPLPPQGATWAEKYKTALQQMGHDDENKKGSEHIYCKVEPKLIEIFLN